MANFIKFYKQAQAPAHLNGAIWFDNTSNLIKVSDGSNWKEFGGIVNATFENGILNIYKANNATPITLDFSDVASAGEVSKILSGVKKELDDLKAKDASLDASIKANATAISTLNTAVTNLDASYKAADTALETKLVGDASDYKTLGALEVAVKAAAQVADGAQTADEVQTAITNAVNALDASVEGVDDSSFVKVKVEEADGKLTAITVTTNDIAKASDLNVHTGNADIHVTADQKTRWTNAAAAIEAFKDAENIGDAVVDTLKEIQDYIASDASAADKMTKDIAAAQATADDASAAAANAQADVDALEEVVGTGFSKESTVSAQLSAVKTTADAAATAANLAKTDASLKSVMDSYVISFGGAKGDVTVKGGQASNGSVNLAVVDNELQASIVGLGSAAFTDAGAYATAAQGELADSAVQSVVEGDTNGTIKVDGEAVAVHGLGSAAFTDASAYDVAGSAAAVLGKAGDASTVMTLYGVKEYANKLAEETGAAATVTGVDSSAVADASQYVSIALKLENKTVKVASVNVDTQTVADAGENAKGLAEASDVKAYVDNQISANALAWTVLE